MKPILVTGGILVVCAFLNPIQAALAADGIWTQGSGLGPYNWSDVANWQDGAVGDAVDSTATFSAALDTNGSQVVNVDVPRTIGHISFESTNRNRTWNISGPEVLTLDVASGSPTINGPATWNGNANTGSIVSAVIAGTDGLTVIGSRLVSITGANTYSGTTTVDGGAARFGSGSIGDVGRTVTGLNGAIVGANYDINNAFLNRFIENDNTFFIATGGNTSNDLDFKSSTGANLPNVSLGVTAANNGTYTYSGTISPANNTYRFGGGNADVFRVSSLLTGSNAVVITRSTQARSPRLQLTNAANDYSGGTTVTPGSTVIGGDFGTGSLTLDGATWQYPISPVTTPVILTTGGGTILTNVNTTNSTTDYTQFNASISGDGNLTLTTPNMGNAVAIKQLNVANTYAGDTILSGQDTRHGILSGVDNVLPTTTVLKLNNRHVGSGRPVWFDLNGFNQEVAGLENLGRSYNAIINSSSTSSTLTVNNDADYTYGARLGTDFAMVNIAGRIAYERTGTYNNKDLTIGASNNFGLTKGGAGKLTLTETHSYSGDTIIANGTLSIQHDYLADTADVKLATGSIFDLNFTGADTIDQLFFDGAGQAAGKWGRINSIADLGADFESSFFTGDGLLEVTTGATIVTDLNSDGIVNDMDLNLRLSEVAWTQVELDALLADFGGVGTPGSPSTVPEPSVFVVLTYGVVGLIRCSRSRKR